MERVKNINKDREVNKPKKIFVILGPTSSGKTSLALDLCKKFDGEIISADSRQVFKFMDVGTGKVPVDSKVKIEKGDAFWLLDGIKVWGYDLATPNQCFSGYDFADFALKKTGEINNRRKNIFVVGGTGFYIDLFTGRITPSKVLPDPDLRELLEELSLGDLQEKLRVLDLETFKKVDQKNKVRLIRAIERNLSKNINNKELPYLEDFEFVYLGLDAPREILYKRSDLWVENIWKNGIVDEVKKLCDLGYGNSSKLKGLVYKTVLEYLHGEICEKDAIERVKFDIHAYIRRQQTWFKKMKDIEWVDITQDGFRELIYNIVKRERTWTNRL